MATLLGQAALPDQATLRRLGRPGPIQAVLFDFHSTLVDQGDPHAWLDAAWAHAGRPGTAREILGEDRYEALAQWVNRAWEHALEIDPHSERDLDPQRHHEISMALLTRLPDVDEELAQAFYEVMFELWIPYEDSLPTLKELKRRGIQIALVSNIGIDIRHVLERAKMLDLIDAVILSFEAGSVKPNAPIFEQALEAVGAKAENALMVGDNYTDDAGAAAIGIRTLILPRTQGAEHGLDVVLRIVGD